jgi:hypothetical protein
MRHVIPEFAMKDEPASLSIAARFRRIFGRLSGRERMDSPRIFLAYPGETIRIPGKPLAGREEQSRTAK